MAKNYLLQFGTGSPTLRTGLTPTMIVFKQFPAGTNITAPGITEIPTSTGLYYFTYGPTGPVSFVVDGGSTVGDSGSRYITGILDPIQAVDEKVGTTVDTVGDTSADPTTVLGYVKRLQELQEGNATFTKSSGAWLISTRGGTALRSKTLADSSSAVTKS